MPFSELKLHPQTVASIYSGNLVLTGDESRTPQAVDAAKTMVYLGENKKKIVILVYDELHSFLSESDFNFLIQILNACKVTVADTAIVNTLKTAVGFKQIEEELNPKVVLCFGKQAAASMQLQITEYQTVNRGGVQMLYADPLSVVIEDAAKKKKLWMELKQLFEL